MGKVAPTLALYGQASDLLSDMCENWCLTRVSMGLDDGRAAVWLVRHGLAKWADGHHREWVVLKGFGFRGYRKDRV